MGVALMKSEPDMVFGRTNSTQSRIMDALRSGDHETLRDHLATLNPIEFDFMFPGDKEREELGAHILASGDPEAIKLAQEHDAVITPEGLNTALENAVLANDSRSAAVLLNSGADLNAQNGRLRTLMENSPNPAMQAAVDPEQRNAVANDQHRFDDPGNVIEDVSRNRYYMAAGQKKVESHEAMGHTPLDTLHEMANIDGDNPMIINHIEGLPADPKRIASLLTNPGHRITADMLDELNDYHTPGTSGPSLG